MRDAFITRLLELARNDPDIVLITGDLGFGVLDEFRRELPGQFLNAGVAEQNMMGIATGLALSGKNVFTYSIGNFPTLRCFEQLRNGACYHEANVTVVAIGGGFSYGPLGFSHHATEDLSVIRALPNVSVVAPGSTWEAWCATEQLTNRRGTAYLRLDKSSAQEPQTRTPFAVGKARTFREGRDYTIIATGGILEEAVAAADELRGYDIHVAVLSMHTVKPLDAEAVLAAARATGGILTLEENTKLGGLGSAVAEVCMEHGVMPRHFRSLGVADEFPDVVGSQRFLRERCGIDKAVVVGAVLADCRPARSMGAQSTTTMVNE